jgi:hypothetical protein
MQYMAIELGGRRANAPTTNNQPPRFRRVAALCSKIDMRSGG